MVMLKRIFAFLTNRKKIKGHNNVLDISKTAFLRKTKIHIYGNNNKVIVGNGSYLHNVYIRIGFPDCPVENCVVKIGNKTSFNSADMQLGENDSSVIIGDNCMFSFNIELACSDTHGILDENGNLINIGKSIEIGSNVWVCKNVSIMKNTAVPDNCIVAQNSVVTKKFDVKNSVIAGNPARVVKNNISWTKLRPMNYLREKGFIK